MRNSLQVINFLNWYIVEILHYFINCYPKLSKIIYLRIKNLLYLYNQYKTNFLIYIFNYLKTKSITSSMYNVYNFEDILCGVIVGASSLCEIILTIILQPLQLHWHVRYNLCFVSSHYIIHRYSYFDICNTKSFWVSFKYFLKN